MKKTFNDYYLGLDIGTDSVGWAVTDLDYNLQKLNGKALWGIRLFEEGKTAAERRIYRSARRRLQRRVDRIKLLQELFSEEISKVDPGFYRRLEDSKFYQEDKTEKQPYALFCDNSFNDKDYYKKYPTMYHLRKALIDDENEFDIRLVYLALHHIIKNRGHFLFEGQSIDNISSFKPVFNELLSYLREEFEIEFDCGSLDEVEEILKSKKIGIREKKKNLAEILNADTKQKQAFINLLSGATLKFSDLFEDNSLDETEIPKICFSDGKYDEYKDQLTDILGERMYSIEKMKAIYDWAILENIRQGNKYLSYTKTATFDKHKKDLMTLKKVIKKYHPEKYGEVFSDNTIKINYCSYVGVCKKKGAKVAVEKKCSQQDLCKYLDGILTKTDAPDEEYEYLQSELTNKTLLPKQTSSDNGVVPYQLHFEELTRILDNASKYLKFLDDIDETGFSTREKIAKIFLFRIPYYVGPLNTAHKGKGNCWIVKQSNEKITPWNFERVVDLEASAEGFIRKMTNKCTYLIGANVIPKNSLLYSEFMVLNELNNLKIDGEKISVGLKQKIYSELFTKYAKVTMKRLRSFLENEGIIQKQNEISGIDGDFKASLKSYLDFSRILGEKIANKKMVEEIILWIVLFGDDKKILKKRLEKTYGNSLSADQKKNIVSLKYAGWGRLSKEFLEDIFSVDKETGEYVNIISSLRNTNENLMQLLSGNFDYLNEIEKYNISLTDQATEIEYKAVDDMYVSPAVKRSIWQTLLIVKEINKVMQHQPKKVFVEMTRGEQEKKRTISRRNNLIELYKACKEDERNWVEEISEKTDGDFRRDRLYLYYTQMGRCMYTGQIIDLNELFNENLYDVDHIFPQSKIKDDSLENRVLVKKDANAKKSDEYPINKDIQTRNKMFWKALHDKKLIGRKKYDRLVRTTPFTDDELADFIARQIVETSQSTKAVAEIIKRVFVESEIVYVKAGNVSDFRQKYEITKSRDVNDYHHAKDAYLNVVVGNVYNTKFTHSPINFIKKYDGKKYNLKRMYDFDVSRNGSTAWVAGNNGTIATVKKTVYKNNILFTRYATEYKGGLYDQMIMKKGKGQLPIKGKDTRMSDIDKYGGYNKVSTAYFMLVEHLQKGKSVRSIEFVPVHLAQKLESNEEARKQYCTDNLELKNPKVFLPKIKINTLFSVDGFRMHLSGRTVDRLIFKGANQLCLYGKEEQYSKNIHKYLKRASEARRELPITSYDGITQEENLKLYDLIFDKLENTIYNSRLDSQVKCFKDGREKFSKLSVAMQCKLLAEALHLFQCNSVASDLSLIGGAKHAGILVMQKNISSNQKICIINQSPSGIFEKEIDLLKL